MALFTPDSTNPTNSNFSGQASFKSFKGIFMGKTLRNLALVFAAVVLFASSAMAIAPVSGDYRSGGAVNTTTITNWYVYNGSTWAAASVVPSSTANVWIQSNHTLTVGGAFSCANLYVSTGTVSTTPLPGIISCGANTLTITGSIESYYGTVALTTAAMPATTLNPGTTASYFNITSSGAGGITFTGATPTVSGGWSIYSTGFTATFAPTGGTATLGTNFGCTNINISTGTLVVGANNLTVAGTWTNAGTVTMGAGTLTLSGTATFGGGTFTPTAASTTIICSGTVAFNYAASFGPFSITAGTTTAGAAITCTNFSTSSGAKLVQGANNLSITGTWTNGGTFTMGQATLALSGTATLTGGTFTPTAGASGTTITCSGTITFDYSTSFGPFNITAGTTTAGTGASITCTNLATTSGATLAMGAYPLTVSGTWTNGGTVTIGTATLTLSGSPTFSGGTFTPTANTTITCSGTVAFNYAITFGPLNVTTGTTTVGASFTCTTLTVSSSGTFTIPTSSANTVTASTVANSANINVTGGTLSVSGASTTGVSNTTGGIFTVNGGIVNLGAYAASNCNRTFSVTGGTLAVSSGNLNIFGNLSITGSPTFNQTGGTISVDGNYQGTGVANTNTTPIVGIGNVNTTFTGTLGLTGGTLIVVDPSYTTGFAFYANLGSASYVCGTGHTLQFGNAAVSGEGTDVGGGNGYYINLWAGYGFTPGNLTIESTSSANNFVDTYYPVVIAGNLLITSGEFRDLSTSGWQDVFPGNVTVTSPGIFTSVNTVCLCSATWTNTTQTTAVTTNVQTVGGTGTFRNLSSSPTANLAGLTVKNTYGTNPGVTLTANLSVLASGSGSGTTSDIALTNGVVYTNGYTLSQLSPTVGTVARTNGWINGTLKWTMPATSSNNTYVFPLGNNTDYLPATLAFTGVTGGGTVTGTLTTGQEPNIASSPINSSYDVNDYWTFSNSGITFTSVAPTFGYNTADILTGATQSSFAGENYNSGWSGFLVSTNAGSNPYTSALPSQTTLSGDFVIGDLTPCSGTPGPGATQASATPVCTGVSSTLSMSTPPNAGGITYQWYSSPTNSGYTIVGGATSSTYAPAISSTIWYECSVSCTNSSSSAISTPVQVVLNTPATQATAVSFAGTTCSSTTVSWTRGSGSSCAVFMYAGASGTAAPVNGTAYAANAAFGSGAQIGSTGWYCIYNGTGTSVPVTALTPGQQYQVMVCEYNCTATNTTYNTSPATGNPGTVTATTGLSGTVTVGTSGNYPTFTGAGGLFAAINACGLAGSLTVNVISNITEPGTNALTWTWVGSPTLTIQPSSATSYIISGTAVTAASPMISFTGSKYVTINGNYSGSGQYLTFTNSNGTASSTGPTISFNGSSTGCTVENCIIESNETTTTTGTILIGTGTNAVTIGPGNNICDNSSGVGTAGQPYNAIYSGTATNTLTSIINNNIYNWTNYGINATSIANSASITGNNFYMTGTATATTQYAIYIAAGNSHTVTGNYIGGSSASASGTWTNSAAATIYGIYYAVASGTASSTFSTNTISGFDLSVATATAPVFYGIYLNTSCAATVSSNTIKGINIPSATGGAAITAISVAGSGNFTIQANNIGSSSAILQNAGTGGIKGIVSSATGTEIIGSPTTSGLGNTITYLSDINGSTTNALLYGISVTGGTNTIGYNNINNLGITASTATGSQIFGISATTGANTISYNNINTLANADNASVTGSASASVIGISSTSTTTGQNINYNTIYALGNSGATGAVAVEGIYYAGPTSGTNSISDNLIHSLTAVSTSATSSLQAIAVGAGGYFANVTDNFIRLGVDINAGNTGNYGAITGISSASTGTMNLDYNTVFITGAATAAGTTVVNTFALNKSATSGTYDVRNNILANNRTGGYTGSYHYALQLNTVTGLSNINNNIYYSNDASVFSVTATPAAISGATSALKEQDFRSLVSAITGGDLNSGIATLAQINFTSATSAYGSLNLSVSSPSSAVQAGTPISAFTTDYYGYTRNATTPYIGAYEGSGETLVDIFTPTITTSISSSTGLALCSGDITPTVTAVITDAGAGIDQSANAPLLWYRETSPSTGTWTSVASSSHTGSSSSATYIWNLSIPGAVSQTYEYYVVAQDLASTPNVWYSAFNATQPSQTNVATQTGGASYNTGAPFLNFSSGATAPLSGTVTVGATGSTYTSFTGAGGLFAAINANGLSGNLTVNVNNSEANETGANALNAWTNNCGGPWTVLIQPADNTSQRIISTASSQAETAMINFNGCTGVTVNGWYNNVTSSTLNLKFVNNFYEPISNGSTTSIGGPAFWFTNNTTYVTIENCRIEAEANEGYHGRIIYLGTSSTTGSGNSYITITGNTIGNSDLSHYTTNADYSPCAIYSDGGNGVTAGAGSANGNNTITNNQIINFGEYTSGGYSAFGIFIDNSSENNYAYNEVANNGNNWTITGNSFYYTGAANAYSGQVTAIGFGYSAATTCSGNIIEYNYFGGQAAGATGSSMLTSSGASYYGLLYDGNGATISYNTFQDITLAKPFTALYVIGNSGTININNNTIGNASTPITGSTGGSSTGFTGIVAVSDGASIPIYNNTIQNVTNTSGYFYGIDYANSSYPCNIYSNTITGNTASSGYDGSSGTRQVSAGIYFANYSGGTTGHVINYNTIQIPKVTGSSYFASGITLETATASTTIGGSMIGNIIYDPASQAASSEYGINITSWYYPLTWTIANNQIDLANIPSGSGYSAGIEDEGNYNSGGLMNYWYNTVYLSGTGTGNSYAFESYPEQSTSTQGMPLNLRNNIFINARSSTTKSYAIGCLGSSSTFSISASGGNASNYNFLVTNNTSSYVGVVTGTAKTFANWKTAFTNNVEGNSISAAYSGTASSYTGSPYPGTNTLDPPNLFVGPSSTPPNLDISLNDGVSFNFVYKNATPLSITSDITTATRNATTPTIGSFEVVYTPATITLASANNPANASYTIGSVSSSGGANNVYLAGFSLTSSASSSTVAGLTFTTSGSANASDYSNFTLVRDVNGNGVYDAGDVAIGSVISTLSSTLSFTGLTESIGTTATNYLLVATVPCTGVAGDQLVAAIAATSTGVISGGNTITGSNVTGGTMTVAGTLPATPANPTSNSPQCAGTPVTITSAANTSGNNWYWETSATGTSLANNASTPENETVSGTYYVVAATSLGCISSGAGSVTITINPTPQGSITMAAVCSGVNATMTWTATAGTGPYNIVYNNSSTNESANGETSGTPFSVVPGNPSNGTVFTLVSVTDNSDGCVTTSGFTGGSATAASSAGLNGTYTIPGSFATLNAAVAAYNANPVCGPVVFQLTSSYPSTTEVFPITIQQNAAASAVNTLTIEPQTGAVTISGSYAGALIKEMGNYVTINGSPGGTGTTQDLTITNTSTTTPYAIWMASSGTTPLNYATVENCALSTGSQTAGYGIVFSDGTTFLGAGYSNNITIQNNSVSKAYKGIEVYDNVTGTNGNPTLITGNTLNATGTSAIYCAGIEVVGCYGATVSNNTVGNISNSNGANIVGVWFATGTNNSVISGNTISGLSYTGSTGAYTPMGIYVDPAITSAAINVYGNNISSITSATAVTGGAVCGIQIGGSQAASGINVYDNTINGISNTNSGGYGACGILLSSTTTASAINVYDNFISNIVTPGNESLAFYYGSNGIVVYGGGGYNIYFNSVYLGTGACTTNAGYTGCLFVQSLASGGTINVENNIFDNAETSPSGGFYTAVFTTNSISTANFSTLNYNDYVGNSTTDLIYINGFYSAASLATAMGVTNYSIANTPSFVSSSTGNLDLNSSGNTAFVAGTAIASGTYPPSSSGAGITLDIAGTTRASTPTIGAFEIALCTPPAAAATINAYSSTTQTGTTVNWTNGTAGSGILILATAGATNAGTPVTGTSYTGVANNAALNSGNELGTSGAYVVYANNNPGASGAVNVSGLASGTEYTFSVYDYNSSTGCYQSAASSSTVYTLPACVTYSAPANGATCTSLAPSLSWAAATGATGYNVYLGTSNPPTASEVSANQAGLTYSASGLTAGQTYYWMVIPVDASGSPSTTTCSTVWSFTTGVATPPTPTVVSACYLQTGSITESGSAPGGWTYYWETSATGTSTTYNASSAYPTPVSGTTYYVIPYSGTCWGAASVGATYTTGTGLGGTYTVGTGGNFTSLTAAVGYANSYGFCSNTIFSLTNTTYSTGETFPIVLSTPSSGNNTSASATLTIQAATGVTATITGANTTGLFEVNNGSGYVTFNGGTGTNHYLSFVNSGDGGYDIELRGACAATEINNCNLQAYSALDGNSESNIYITHTGTSAITVQNCNIHDYSYSASEYAGAGIYCTNTGAVLTISNNNIYNCNIAGVELTGCANGCTVSNNSVYYQGTFSSGGATGIQQEGIEILAGSGHTVSGNYIGGQSANGGTSGSPWTISSYDAYSATLGGDGYAYYYIVFQGIVVSESTTTSPVSSTISNNVVQNFSLTYSGTYPLGFEGIESDYLSTVSGNTVGSTTSGLGIIIGASANPGAASFDGVQVGNPTYGAVTATGNTIANVTVNGSGTYYEDANSNVYTGGFAALQYFGDNNGVISNNTIYNIATNATWANSITTTPGSVTSANDFTSTDYSNNFNTATGIYVTDANTSTYGITTGLTVSGNTLYNLQSTATSAVATDVVGIGLDISAGNLYDNKIYGITNTATGTSTYPGIAGVRIWGGSGWNVYNNQVILSNTNNATVFGMTDLSGSTEKYYFNSVYTGGSATGPVSSAFDLRYNSTGITLKDNILYNMRSATGGNYCISLPTNPSAFVSDYNELYAGGTSGYIALKNATNESLSGWQGAYSGVDVTGQSQNVQAYFSQSNPPTSDLTLAPAANCNLAAKGIAITSGTYPPSSAGITVDYNGTTRPESPNTAPTMGAIEVVNTFPTISAGSNQTICHGAAATLAGTQPPSDGIATGAWTPTSGLTYNISSALYNATVSGLAVGSNVLTWTVTDGSCTGNNTVTITMDPALAATISPSANSSICNSTTAPTFTATATGGSGSYTYQWYNGSTSLGSGAMSSTYAPGVLSTAGAYNYNCSVTDASCGSIVTSTTTITVDAPVTCSQLNPITSAICYNTDPGVFTATGGGGTGSYTYLWYNNSTSTGVTTNTYDPGVLTANADIYCVATSGSCVTGTSTAYTVVVYGNITAVQANPVSAAICYNTDPGAFTVTAGGGTGSYTYLWYNNSNATGVITNTYNPGSLTSNASIYCAVTSESCGTVSSTTYTVVVSSDLSATQSGGTSPVCYNTSPGTFTASGSGGTGSYTYQWFKNGTAEVTTDTYNPGNLTATSTIYCAVTSGSCGTYNTLPSTISVYSNLTASQANASSPVCYGTDPGTFTATGAGGNNAYTYSWYLNGTPIGGTSSTYDPGVLYATSTVYCAVTSGTCGTVNTTAFTITVDGNLSASQNAGTTPVCYNSSPGTFTATGTGGTGAYTYQWYINSSPAVTTNTYAPGNLTATSTIYCAVTSGSCGTVNTAASTISVYADLSAAITGGTSPSCYNTSPGTFTATGTGGTGAYSYQWYKTSGSISGETSSTYDPGSLTASETYSCSVTSGSCGTVTTGTAPITIEPPVTSYGSISASAGLTQTVCDNVAPNNGSPLVVSGAAGSSGLFTYQWYFQTGLVAAPTGSSTAGWTACDATMGTGYNTSSFIAAGSHNNITFACFVIPATPVCGSGQWAANDVQVTVLTTGPTETATGGASVCLNSAITLNSSLSVGIPATYQWFSSTSPGFGSPVTISGATSTSYSPPVSTAGTMYYEVVATFSGSGCNPATSNTQIVTVYSVPTASTSGGNTPICYGTSPGVITATAAGGSGSFSYQWYNSSSSVSGATASTYNPGNLTASNSYYCSVTDLAGCGSVVTSPDVNITVDANLTAAISGGTTPICYNTSPGTFTATGGGGIGTYTYQWYNGSGLIAGETASTYSPGSITTSNSYFCAITSGSCGTLNTPVKNITVHPNLTAGISGGTSPVCYNTAPGTIKATASGGSGVYTYQWYNSGGAISGATASTYAPGNLTASDTYYCNVTGGTCGSVNTGSVAITVYGNLAAAISGGTTPVCYNSDPGTFTVTGSGGTGSYTYQWYNGSGQISGATSNTYAPGNLTAGDSYYAAVESGSCGTVNSSATSITVNSSVSATISGGSSPVCYNTSPGTFTASGSGGSGIYSYQWYNGAGSITGATAATFNPGGITISNSYHCDVTDASCGTGSSNVIDISVNAQTSVTASNTGPYVAGQNISLLSSSAGATGYAWSGPLGFTSGLQNPDIAGATTGMAGTYTVTATDASGCVATATTDVEVTTTAAYTWTGTTSTSWSEPTNWVPTAPTGGPNSCAIDVLIPSVTNNPVISSAIQVGNIQMNAGAQLTLNAFNISVCKNWTGASGTKAVVAGSGVVVFNGSISQTITGATQMQELQLANSAGAIMHSGSALDIYTALDLANGNFDASNGTLTFKSTSVTDVAIIDNFSSGYSGTLSGSIKAERYYAPSVTNDQHFMGSPVNSPSLAQFGASGTTGNVIDANCDEQHLSSGSPYGTVFELVESAGATCGLDQWKVVTQGNAANGSGYSILKAGTGTLVLSGTANLAPSYSIAGLTNSNWSNTTLQNHTENSGWTLVSNPYLATLNISTASSGIDNQVQIWNANGGFAGSYQPGVIGTDATIAPFQAFMVHKTTAGGNATFTMNATDRVRTPQTFFAQNANQLNIVAANITTGLLDQTTVAFNPAATDTFDAGIDAAKFPGVLNRHTLYTVNNNQWMARNVLHDEATTTTVPMGFEPGKNGTYKLTFNGLSSFDPTSYIYLEDKALGIMYNVRNGDYTFAADSADNWNRFVLHFTPPAVVTTVDASCSAAGTITIQQPGTANWNYTLTTNSNAIITSGTLNQSQQVTVGVAAGTYVLTLIDTNNYVVNKTITVNGPEMITADFQVSNDVVQSGQNVTLTATSAGASTYQWNFGNGASASGITASVSYAQPGVYAVSLMVSNSSGCSSVKTENITVNANTTGLNNISGTGNIRIWSHDNKVYVDFTGVQLVNASVTLYDILGQEISAENVKDGNLVFQQEIDNLDAGYVIVLVRNDDKILTRKVFISNSK